MRIAYFGLPLGALLLARDGHELQSVALSPVAAPGRRRLVRLLGQRVIEAGPRQDPGFVARIEALWCPRPPDVIVSWFWTRPIAASWLGIPRWGGVGVHPSLLPRHRGPDPYFWAIDSGDESTGVTVHRLEPSYDTGGILAQASAPVGRLNSWQLARRLDEPGLATLRGVLASITGSPPLAAVEQEHAATSWAPRPEGEALRVDWNWPTERVLRRIRALAPVPGLGCEVEGVPLNVVEASAASAHLAALKPGEAEVSERLSIRTLDGAVAIDRAWHEAAEPRLLDGAEIAALVRVKRPMLDCDPLGDHP